MAVPRSAPLKGAFGIASGGLTELSELEPPTLRPFRWVSERASRHHKTIGAGDQIPVGPRWDWCHVPQVRDNQKTHK